MNFLFYWTMIFKNVVKAESLSSPFPKSRTKALQNRCLAWLKNNLLKIKRDWVLCQQYISCLNHQKDTTLRRHVKTQVILCVMHSYFASFPFSSVSKRQRNSWIPDFHFRDNHRKVVFRFGNGRKAFHDITLSTRLNKDSYTKPTK